MPSGRPRDGTSVSTFVSMASEGGEWVARSEPGLGSIELHLRLAGASTAGYAVVGSIAGTARDVGLMGVIRDVNVTVASATGVGGASLEGETTSRVSRFMVGRVTGALRFSDSHSSSSTCPAIRWSLQPY
jgi:hypothetical protein